METWIVILAIFSFTVATAIIGRKRMRDARLALKARLRKQYGMSPNKKYTQESVRHIPKYFETHRSEDALDDITWNDLAMDDVYARINYCRSAAGEEVLYHVLRHPVEDREPEAFENKVLFFMKEQDTRVDAQVLFEGMKQQSSYSIYDHLMSLEKDRDCSNFSHYAPLVIIVFLIGACFVRFTMSFVLLILMIIFNLLTYYREKGELDAYLSTFQNVLRLISGASGLSTLLKKSPGKELFESECKEMDARVDAMKVFRAGSAIALSGNRQTGGSPLDLILDYLRIATHIDLIFFNRMYVHLLRHVEDVDRLVSVSGMCEVYLAVACYRASLKEAYCLPEFTDASDGQAFLLEDGYHPLLMTPVANTIRCEKNVLITGSNASGKSTFLKTAGIAAVMAQTIRTVCASSYRAPRYRIYSSMALNDNLLEGDSYYIVEIKSLKRILDAASSDGLRVLCFIDEVLRGTNTLERIAASAQILKQFCNRNVQCFAATHDGELTEILKGLYDNYHFDGEITEGDVRFDYRLREGIAKTRNAVQLLRMLGYDASIVDEADAMAARFLQTGEWTLS